MDAAKTGDALDALANEPERFGLNPDYISSIRSWASMVRHAPGGFLHD